MGKVLRLDANGDLVWIDEDTGTISGNLFANDIVTSGYRLTGIESLDKDCHTSIFNFTNDGDGNNNTITLAGEYGTLVVDTLGNYTYNLDNAAVQFLSIGTFAKDTFKYFVTDNTGRKDSADLTIRIAGSNDNPIAADDHNKVILVEDDDREVVTGNVISGKGNYLNMGADIDPDSNFHFWDNDDHDHRDDHDEDYDERGIMSRLRVTDIKSLSLGDNAVHLNGNFVSGPGNHHMTI